MRMTRLSISVPSDLREELVLRAARSRRSISSYVSILIEADMQANVEGLPVAVKEARALGIDPVSAIRAAIAMHP